MDPLLVRLLIAVLVYYLFNLVITTFVTRADAQRIFQIILLILCVLFALFGSFTPFHL